MAVRLKVKDVAQAQGISQRQLFLKSGVDIRTIRRIFQHPTTTVVTTETLDKLAQTLHVDVSMLLESIPAEDEQPAES